jgi:hypothetical protein
MSDLIYLYFLLTSVNCDDPVNWQLTRWCLGRYRAVTPYTYTGLGVVYPIPSRNKQATPLNVVRQAQLAFHNKAYANQIDQPIDLFHFLRVGPGESRCLRLLVLAPVQ